MRWILGVVISVVGLWASPTWALDIDRYSQLRTDQQISEQRINEREALIPRRDELVKLKANLEALPKPE